MLIWLHRGKGDSTFSSDAGGAVGAQGRLTANSTGSWWSVAESRRVCRRHVYHRFAVAGFDALRRWKERFIAPAGKAARWIE